MGTVDLAVRREGEFRRLYAIKRLRKALRDDRETRAMFVEEARIAGMLHHPNLVGVLDVGTDEDGPYLVMDFVEGVSLSMLLREVTTRGELLPVQLVARVMKQVCDGLSAAHRLASKDGEPLGLIHRDISPQNILIGYDGVSRLTDFGIAKAAYRADGTRTNTGVLKGKFSYLSPEQLQFHPASQRSDLFALGVVLFEALACRKLFSGEDQLEVARRILTAPPPDVMDYRDDVPTPLIELGFELLAKDPQQRPATAKEIADRLETVLAQLLIVEDPVAVGDYVNTRFEARRRKTRDEVEALTSGAIVAEPRGERRRRSPLVIAFGAVVVSVVIGGGVAVAMGVGGPEEEPPPSSAHAPRATPPVEEAPSPSPERPIQQPAPIEPTDVLSEAASNAAPSDAPATPSPSRRARRARRPRPVPSTPAAAPEPEPPAEPPRGLAGWGN